MEDSADLETAMVRVSKKFDMTVAEVERIWESSPE
jgi:hypothetical protein